MFDDIQEWLDAVESDDLKKTMECFNKVVEVIKDYDNKTIIVTLCGMLGQTAAQSIDVKMGMSIIFKLITKSCKGYLEDHEQE